MRFAVWLLVLYAGLGCTVPTDTDPGSDAGPPCDGKDDCNQCSTCAVQVACALALDACQRNSACVAIDECVTLCGADLACKQGCVDGNPAGINDYLTVTKCIYCDECPADCAGYRSC